MDGRSTRNPLTVLRTGLELPSTWPPFKHVELEINTACDLACFACDRFSDVTSAPNMTVRQVQLFVQESLELGWPWERVRLLGGEPTIHPQFDAIVDVLVEYRAEAVRRGMQAPFLQVLTNGRGKCDVKRARVEALGISMHAEAKAPGQQPPWFNNTRIAPVDRDPSVGELPPCGIFDERGCGIGLTRHGYFLDGAGASVARVAGLDVGRMHLSEVTWETMLEQAKVLCRLCGHWNPTDGSPQVTQLVSRTGQVTGKFWTEALRKFKEARPALSVYGS